MKTLLRPEQIQAIENWYNTIDSVETLVSEFQSLAKNYKPVASDKSHLHQLALEKKGRGLILTVNFEGIVEKGVLYAFCNDGFYINRFLKNDLINPISTFYSYSRIVNYELKM